MATGGKVEVPGVHMPTQAYITQSLLVWARQRAGRSQEPAARSVGVAELKLAAWERMGKGIGPAYSASGADPGVELYAPFGYPYLSAIPNLEIDLLELRTATGQPRFIPGSATPPPS